LQRLLASGLILLPPAAHRLIAHLQPSADLTVVELLAEQLERSQPSVLQSLKITAHSTRVSHTH
jgi:hypothetical protein